MTLRRRLDRLEAKRAPCAPGPTVVILCAAETGEPMAVLLMGGGALVRADGEAVDHFTTRAVA